MIKASIIYFSRIIKRKNKCPTIRELFSTNYLEKSVMLLQINAKMTFIIGMIMLGNSLLAGFRFANIIWFLFVLMIYGNTQNMIVESR